MARAATNTCFRAPTPLRVQTQLVKQDLLIVDELGYVPLSKTGSELLFEIFSQRYERCFRHQLLLPRPYLVLTKPLRLDIQCQRAASVKIGWKYLDD